MTGALCSEEGGVRGGFDVSIGVCALSRRDRSGEATWATLVSGSEATVRSDVDAELVVGLCEPGAEMSACSALSVCWLEKLGVALEFLLLLKTSLILPAGDFDRLEARLWFGCSPVLLTES